VIFITGDCHADWSKFSTDSFPEQKEMTRDDYVIVCGDFGVWHPDNTEKWWLRWLSEKNFTLLFVDGNHENFDRLYSDEFEIVDFHGGKAHRICENVYHLMRGYVFELCGKKFFAFGGASSHDIQDGILEPSDYKSTKELVNDYNKRTQRGEMLRINHISWWKQEMPSEDEMKFGLETLRNNGNKVDYIVSHCCPQEVASLFSHGFYKPDKLTDYFNTVARTTEFSKWFFGHYHNNKQILDKFIMLYEQIVRVA
jgi:hypothetical protein